MERDRSRDGSGSRMPEWRYRGARVALCGCLLLILPGAALGTATALPGLLDDFWANFGDAHWGWNLAFHLGAASATLFFVESGTDAAVQKYFRQSNPIGQGMADWALLYGNIWHLVPAAVCYWHGRAVGDRRLAGAGAAGLQAVFSTFLANTTLKIVSGRKGPGAGSGQDSFIHGAWSSPLAEPDDFDFRFWQNDLAERRFFWPSGHTSTAFAFAAAMTAYYPDRDWVPWVLYPLAAFMGAAMIEGDFHWFSDVVAGALMGHAIGWTVGVRYRGWYLGRTAGGEGARLSVSPLLIRDVRGALASLRI